MTAAGASRRWRVSPAAGVVALLMFLPDCVCAQSKPPIKIGAIASASLFPESTAAVKAYFDIVNAAGGIQGRQLVLVTQDDQGEPAKARAAAKHLVEVEQVVANVGSASATECAVNASYYEQEGLISIQGTGVDPACFQSANISPVNAGPYLSTVLALQFLTDVRSRARVCVYATSYAPVQTEAFTREIQEWSRRTGNRIHKAAVGLAPDADLAPQLRGAIAAGCEGVVYAGIEKHVIDWMTTAGKLKTSIDWVFLTPAYTAGVAQRLSTDGEGMFAMSEFEPWTSRSGMLTDWRDVMTRGRVPRTSFSQGGYVAALVFTRVLRSIKGDINRASVTSAFKKMEPQPLPMLGTRFEFGDKATHASNRANVPVRLQSGRWVIAHWDFISAPSTNR